MWRRRTDKSRCTFSSGYRVADRSRVVSDSWSSWHGPSGARHGPPGKQVFYHGESREPLSATEKRKQSVALRAESDAQPREALKSLLSLWPSVVLAFLLCVKKYFLSLRGSSAPAALSKACWPARAQRVAHAKCLACGARRQGRSDTARFDHRQHSGAVLENDRGAGSPIRLTEAGRARQRRCETRNDPRSYYPESLTLQGPGSTKRAGRVANPPQYHRRIDDAWHQACCTKVLTACSCRESRAGNRLRIGYVAGALILP
jgi:hypothetical protein